MRDRPHDDFGVSVDVHLEAVIRASSAGDDLVVVSRSTFSNETSFANVTAIVPGSRKVITVMSVASKEHIKLWWPNGLGNQPLYDLEISLQDSSFKLITPWVRKRIGPSKNVLYSFLP
jgi:beta-mannosidase